MTSRGLAGVLAVVGIAGCATDATSTTEQPYIAVNYIAVNEITSNAIAANAVASERLAGYPVAGWVYSTGSETTGVVTDRTLGLALEDPAAQMFMKYFVGCAFDEHQHLEWQDHTGYVHPWHGALGMCPQWLDGKPDQACRERVSGCILARNNAFGISVQLSMRGTVASGGAIPLSDRAPTHHQLLVKSQPVTSAPVPSFDDCPPQTKGETRNCGWHPGLLGKCTPGEHVAIAAGNESWCGSGEWLGTRGTVDEVLRVCDGNRGCDHGSPEEIGSSRTGSCGGPPQLEFTCPKSGLYSVLRGGYLSTDLPDAVVGSTMIDSSRCLHPANKTGPALDTSCSACTARVCDEHPWCCDALNGDWDATCVKVAETSCRYPAAEGHVFRWREGSFYGDLFGRKNINPNKPEIFVDQKDYSVWSRRKGDAIRDGGEASRNFIGVAFPNMYACASRNWKQPLAYLQYRVCAGPDPVDGQYTRDCAAHFVDYCEPICDTLDDNSPGDYDAARCRDFNGRIWETPATSLLAQPCDAVADPVTCMALWNPTQPDLDW